MSAINDLRPTPDVIVETYQKLCDEAPSWFSVSLRIDQEDFITFKQWCEHRVHRILQCDNILLFLTHDFHPLATQFHPCFLPPHAPAKSAIPTILHLTDYVKQLGYRRLATTVALDAGRTIRKLLVETGFQKEGIIRGHSLHLCKETGQYTLLDSEFWSMIIEGD